MRYECFIFPQLISFNQQHKTMSYRHGHFKEPRQIHIMNKTCCQQSVPVCHQGLTSLLWNGDVRMVLQKHRGGKETWRIIQAPGMNARTGECALCFYGESVCGGRVWVSSQAAVLSVSDFDRIPTLGEQVLGRVPSYLAYARGSGIEASTYTCLETWTPHSHPHDFGLSRESLLLSRPCL